VADGRFAVPFFCPDMPPLKKNPVFLYSSDPSRKPNPFQADIAVDIGPVFEQKVDALMALPEKPEGLTHTFRRSESALQAFCIFLRRSGALAAPAVVVPALRA